MITKRTFTMTVLLASIVMLPISGATQVYAQVFSPAQVDADTDLDVVFLGDESGSIDNDEYEFLINGVKSGLTELFDQIPELFGNVRFTYIGFGDAAHLRCGPTDIDDQTDLDSFIACIMALITDPDNPTKDNGLTRWDLALQMAGVQFDSPSDLVDDITDEQVVDIVTDGNPTTPGQSGAQALLNALDARDDLVSDQGLDKLTGLAVGNNINTGNLAQLGHPGAPVPVDPSPIPSNSGFVLTAGTFAEFEEAFQAKLFGELCDLLPPDDPRCVVGGEFLPIDTTALLIAGFQSSMIWMLPAVAGIAGTGAYFIRARMNKD